MADYTISAANLNAIENNLNVIHQDLDVVNSNINTTNDNVKVVYDEIGQLAQDFKNYISYQQRVNNKQDAQNRLVDLQLKMDKQFGHYDVVRRTATGILQADDLGIVKNETISNASEELMISTPGYWLAPALVALAAWINNQPELADKAVREAIKRDDEKTSLFFALICRRADRKQAALKWTQRFLENQDEENLDRKTVIILDAFASGLLGTDSEGVVSKQIEAWLDHLSDKPGFVEQQISQWSDAINLKREPVDTSEYTYLRKYSHTWPVLEDIMEGANLHAIMYNYLDGIFSQEVSTDTLKEQLDDILNSLVTEFDDEELPIRREMKYNEMVVEFDGDVDRARQNMAIEQTAFETHKDFTQLLTDAAMKPESSHASVSTQKFAIALTKDWITDAYNDIIAQNRAKIPFEIELNVDTYNDKTQDGSDEETHVRQFNELVDREKAAALDKCKMSMFEQYAMYAGIAIGVVGLIMMLAHHGFLGFIAIVAGIGMVIYHFSKKKQIETTRQNIENQCENKRTNGTQIIRATIAEVVDFRMAFEEKDAESQNVLDFLEQVNPEQYVRKLADTNRRIRVN